MINAHYLALIYFIFDTLILRLFSDPEQSLTGCVSLLPSSLLASIFSSLFFHARITRTGGRECFHRLQLNTKVSGIVQILRQFKVHLSLYERGERRKI